MASTTCTRAVYRLIFSTRTALPPIGYKPTHGLMVSLARLCCKNIFPQRKRLSLRELGATLVLASLLICLNHCLLFRRFNRAGASRAHLRDSIFGRAALRDEIAGQDGSCAAKTCTAMDSDRQAMDKKAINDGESLLNLLQSWCSKISYREMFPLELVFSEEICRQALFRKTQ